MPFSFPLPEKDITHPCYFTLTTLITRSVILHILAHLEQFFSEKYSAFISYRVYVWRFLPEFNKFPQKLRLHPVLYISYKNIVNIMKRLEVPFDRESWFCFIVITFHCTCVYFLLLLYTILNNSYRGLMWTVFQIREQLITKTKLYMPRVVTTARY